MIQYPQKGSCTGFGAFRSRPAVQYPHVAYCAWAVGHKTIR